MSGSLRAGPAGGPAPASNNFVYSLGGNGRDCGSNCHRLAAVLALPALDLRPDLLGEQAHGAFYLSERLALVTEAAVDLEIADQLTPLTQLRHQRIGVTP